jgi:hypothetical protein
VKCGTTACIAGWAVQLAGDFLLVQANQIDDGTYNVMDSVAKNGRVCDISGRARKLLGLNYEEADALFLSDDDDAMPLLGRLIAGEDISDTFDDEYEDDDD